MAGQGDKCFFQVFILNPFKARMTTRADLFPVGMEGQSRGGTDSCHSSIHLPVSVHIDCGGCRLASTHTHTPTHTSGPF